MREPLRKELMACFKREFERYFPHFEYLGLSDQNLIWQRKQSSDLTFFIMLQPMRRYDQFTLEVAWSESGKFPWAGIGKTKIEGPIGRERLSRLWYSGPDEPVWDLAPEKTAADEEDMQRRLQGQSRIYPPDPPIERVLPRVCPLAKDAVEKLVQYGVPLFRRVSAHRGLNWPLGSKVVV